MAKYDIQQYSYAGKSSCLTNYPDDNSSPDSKVYPINLLGSQSDHGDLTTLPVKSPYQQIILNGTYVKNGSTGETRSTVAQNFSTNVPYYLRLTIPRNENYDLNFALLLIPNPHDAGDLDQMSYQFLRYIHVPRDKDTNINQTYVVVYAYPKFTFSENSNLNWEEHWANNIPYNKEQGEVDPLKKAISWEPQDDQDKLHVEEAFNYDDYINKTDQEIGKFKNRVFYRYEKGGANYYILRELPNGVFNERGSIEKSSYCFKNFEIMYGENFHLTAPIGIVGSILNHSWMTKNTDKNKCVYDIIFKPRGADNRWSKLYLYLIPQVEDNDISWLYDDQVTGTRTQFYGRHVDLDKVDVELYELNNLIQGNNIVTRIGIWGRSELMFTINGEEIKIGPSGYYEVQDFKINYLGVAARDNRDQFTIDTQYVTDAS